MDIKGATSLGAADAATGMAACGRTLVVLSGAEAMDRAVDLALLGPAADPNPRVGCVLIAPDDRLLGEGYHRGAGSPHAEAAALTDARERGATDRQLRTATAYVTLEPCDHRGRTGPCSQALLDAGVAAVVYAVPDPGPESAGGAARLRAHGIHVEHRPHAGAAKLTRRWRESIRLGRPWVTWKVAATLDGRTAAPDGTSRWITSAAARADVHRLRAQCGAILVGTGTALTDDPGLTVRADGSADGELAATQPLRVVLGERDLPSQARLRDGAAPLLQLRHRDTAAALAALHERQVRRVLLEGGATLAAAFLRAGLVDEIVAYLAPALLGGGPSWAADLGSRTIDDIRRYRITATDLVGDDLRLTLRPGQPGSGDSAASDERADPTADDRADELVDAAAGVC